MTLPRRAATALRRHGVAGLPTAAARRLAASARERLDAAGERAFDRRRGIATTGVVRASESAPSAGYQPVHPKAFRDLLAHVPAERRAMTFVDYGSGRGRALLLALEHGFGAAVGVEVEPALHRDAEANLARYRAKMGRDGAIRLIEGDARHFRLPSGPVVVFLYNPCAREVLIEILAGIRGALREEPRPAWIVYEAPLDRDLLDADPAFALVAQRTERAGASARRPRFAVYRAV